MPSYLNVPAVKTYGVRVPKMTGGQAYVIPRDRRLIAIVDNREYQLAEDITTVEARERLYNDLERMIWTNISLYAVKEDDIRNGKMTGGCRFQMDDTPVLDPGKWLCPR